MHTQTHTQASKHAMCVRVCVCVCARACVCVRVRACTIKRARHAHLQPACTQYTELSGPPHRVTEAIESYQKASDVFQYEFGLAHPRSSTVMRNLSRVKQRTFDFHVSFAPRKPTPCPAVLVGGAKSKKKGKGKKGGGKKKKK